MAADSDIVGRLREAEAAVGRVKALADLLGATPPIAKPPAFYAEGIRAALEPPTAPGCCPHCNHGPGFGVGCDAGCAT